MDTLSKSYPIQRTIWLRNANAKKQSTGTLSPTFLKSKKFRYVFHHQKKYTMAIDKDFEDLLFEEVSKLPFLKDYKTEFTVEEVRILIRLLFPSRTKTINRENSSYGIKHLFERVSIVVNKKDGFSSVQHKYCNNEIVKEAFESEGFYFLQHGPNRHFNISRTEVRIAYKLFS